MATLTLICCSFIFPSVFLLMGRNIKFYKKSFRKFQKFINKRGPLIGLLCIILIFTSLFVIPTTQSKRLIGDAEVVCTIGHTRKIFHDVDSDKYFILREDDWNIFNMYQLEYIDNDTAEKIIESVRIIDEWNR